MNTNSKIITIDELKDIVQKLRTQSKKIVATNGAFDLLHVGHLEVLEKSKSLGDVLFVGVNSDKSVKSYKAKNRPIVEEADRARMIAGLQCVDYVVIFEDSEPIEFMEQLKPDVYVKGGDYDIPLLESTGWVRDNTKESVIVPLKEGKSTTNIIEKILKSEE